MKIKHLLGSLAVAATVALGSIEAASAAPGYLTGEDFGSRVTLRSGPSTQTHSLGYGLVGQDIEVLDVVYNEYDGHYWAEVYFYESGASGYVRGDFVQMY